MGVTIAPAPVFRPRTMNKPFVFKLSLGQSMLYTVFGSGGQYRAIDLLAAEFTMRLQRECPGCLSERPGPPSSA